MSSAKQQLEALLSLVNESARLAITEYEKTDAGVPSPYAREPHPLDNSDDVIALKKAIRVLEGAFDQLCSTLAPPSHTLLNRAQDYYWACMAIAQRARIAEHLRDHPEGLSVQELEKKSGIESQKLSRVLRMLATRLLFVEVSPGVFANNRLSANLIHNGMGEVVEIYTVDGMAPTLSWYDALLDQDYAASYEPSKSAFVYNRTIKEGKTGGVYDYLKEKPERGAVFARSMMGLSHAAGSLGALNHFPWGDYKSIADLGSGIGTFSMELSKRQPHLKVVLQDLPNTIEQARKYWDTQHPVAVKEDKVAFQSFNFFADPPVPNLDVYFYRYTIHNWPDKEAIQMLQMTRKAMGPQSRLIIQDYVLQNPAPVRGDDQEANLAMAPEPMLPNYGAGSLKHYSQDITMLLLYNAKERTVDEHAELGRQAGLRLEKVWDLADTSLLQFVAE